MAVRTPVSVPLMPTVSGWTVLLIAGGFSILYYWPFRWGEGFLFVRAVRTMDLGIQFSLLLMLTWFLSGLLVLWGLRIPKWKASSAGADTRELVVNDVRFHSDAGGGYGNALLLFLEVRSELRDRTHGHSAVTIRYDVRGREWLFAEKRCFMQKPKRTLVVCDRLRLWKGHREFADQGGVLALPDRASELPECCSRVMHGGGEEMVAEGEDEGDLLDMRLYREGDSARLVLWKLYARTGKFYVRTPEVVGGERYAVFFARGKSDRASARLLLLLIGQDGLNPNWIFQCPSDSYSEPVAGNPEEARRMLAASGHSRDLPSDLELNCYTEFLQQVSRERIGNLLIFLPEDEMSFCKWDTHLTPACVRVFGVRGLSSDPDRKQTEPGGAFFMYEDVQVA